MSMEAGCVEKKSLLGDTLERLQELVTRTEDMQAMIRNRLAPVLGEAEPPQLNREPTVDVPMSPLVLDLSGACDRLENALDEHDRTLERLQV